MKSKVKFGGRVIDLEPKDLAVEDLSNDNIREVISKAPAQYAFYMSMAAEVNERIVQLKQKEDDKSHTLYARFDEPKRTETWKKTQVRSAGRKFFEDMAFKIAKLETLKAKLRAIATAYDMQVKALQTAGGLLRTEMETIMSEARTLDG